jgi:hypothetical protein
MPGEREEVKAGDEGASIPHSAVVACTRFHIHYPKGERRRNWFHSDIDTQPAVER